MANKSVFAGALSFIGLADVFQTLGGNNSTGRLQIKNQYAPNPGVIYFENGNPINAALGKLHGLDAIYPLFGWTEGKFQFFEEKVQASHVIENSRMQILLDALRMLDDGLIKEVGPPSFGEVSGAKGDKSKDAKKETLPVIKGPLVDYVYVIDEDKFSDGDRIVKEGGHGRWIWVILEGVVKVIREISGSTVTLAQLGEGCFVGGFTSLLSKEAIRSASVIAVGDVQLGVLNADQLSREFASISSDLERVLLCLDGRLRKISEKAVDLYMKKPQTDDLTGDTKSIIEKGSSKEELFSITEGKAYLIGQTPQGNLPLLTLEKEDVFGHLPFVDVGHEPRFASVLASKDLNVTKLDMESLQKEYDQLSGTLRNLIYSIGSCISGTTGLAFHLHAGK